MANQIKTRMHSSRMRTVRTVAVCWGVSASVHARVHPPPLWPGPGHPPGLSLDTPPGLSLDTLPHQASAWTPPGQTPPPPVNRQTPVKT